MVLIYSGGQNKTVFISNCSFRITFLTHIDIKSCWSYIPDIHESCPVSSLLLPFLSSSIHTFMSGSLQLLLTCNSRGYPLQTTAQRASMVGWSIIGVLHTPPLRDFKCPAQRKNEHVFLSLLTSGLCGNVQIPQHNTQPSNA